MGIRVGEQFIGSRLEDDAVSFSVWAAKAKHVEVHISPAGKPLKLTPAENGYFQGRFTGLMQNAKYCYSLDGGKPLPDPASQFQPEGVHGHSQVVCHAFQWQDQGWRGIPMQDLIIYELHIGTFSKEGTFDGVIPHLQYLVDLGITAIEIMPVAQFPGTRNWGYDGVFPFAVQNSYGGPDGLKRLVNAAHMAGLVVLLDVVYNHLGPEGNYLGEFGYYFNQEYRTPWGAAINFDGPHSDEVRNYFLQNALYWKNEFHLDGLRLDAVHAIRDFSAYPFLRELKEFLGKDFYLIAESDLNDPRVINDFDCGGWGHDAQWADDFHHCVHHLLTGESNGYYADYTNPALLEKTLQGGYAFTGQYSNTRKRRHGLPPAGAAPRQFVVCSQNHDQVGNRFLGERLAALTDVEGLKLAAATTLLSPFTPLLFMGEEYGEPASFLYFADHSDKSLIEAVKNGRKEEFASFNFHGEAPDPFAIQTFDRCKLNHSLRQQVPHAELLNWYRQLIHLRKKFLATDNTKEWPAVTRAGKCFLLHYKGRNCLLILNFEDKPHSIHLPDSTWELVLSSKPLTHKGSKDSLALPERTSAFLARINS